MERTTINVAEECLLSLNEETVKNISNETLKYLRALLNREASRREDTHPYTKLLEWKRENPLRTVSVFHTKIPDGWIAIVYTIDENKNHKVSSAHSIYSEAILTPKKEATKLAAYNIFAKIKSAGVLKNNTPQCEI